MSRGIRALTLVVLVLPMLFFVLSVLATRLLLAPALFVTAIYGWVWLWLRPTQFVVHPALSR